MVKFLDLVLEKRWMAVVLLLLISVVSFAGPLAVRQAVNDSMKEMLTPIIESVECIEEIQFQQVLEGGIAGYKKINGDLDKLESSTQNSAAIKIALSIPRIRDILFTLDRENTLLYEEYFRMN